MRNKMYRKLLIVGTVVLLLGAVLPLLQPSYFPKSLTLSQVIDNPKPFCSLNSSVEKEFQEGSKLTTWNLTVSGLKTLKASLFFIQSGSSRLVSSTEYNWVKWEASTESAKIKLELLMQDSQPFGVLDKCLFLMTTEIEKAPSYSRREMKESFLLEGKLTSKSSIRATSAESLNQKDNVIYAKVFLSPNENMKTSESYYSIKSIVDDSLKDKRNVMAIDLEWAPQDPN